MYTILISSTAEQQISKAFNYYQIINPSLSKKLKNEILSVIDYISINPLSISINYSNVRVKFLSKFSFGVHFKIYDNNEIVILSFYHTSQDSNHWNLTSS